MGYFWPKYIMFEFRKYRGVMFHVIQDWYKFWRKTDLCFQKWYEIFTRALESLKIGTLMATFCLQLKMYEFKIYGGVMCHDNEKWCKILKKMTCQSKIDMSNLTNFDPSTGKSQNFAL